MPRVRRIVLSLIAAPAVEPGDPPANEQEARRVALHVTFTHRDGVFTRDEGHGFHPMMAERLALWRLGSFRVERLPSADDVYVFHGVAQDNAKDERLFAIVEVRDMTPVRDEDGRIVALPAFERMLIEALTAIRREQSRRSVTQRLQWNRIMLYVRPPWAVSRAEMSATSCGSPRDGRRRARAGGGPRPSGRRRHEADDGREVVIHISNPVGRGLVVSYAATAPRAIRPSASTSEGGAHAPARACAIRTR